MDKQRSLKKAFVAIAVLFLTASNISAAPQPFNLVYPANNDTISPTQPRLMWGSAGQIDTFINENMNTAPSGTLRGTATYDAANKWLQCVPAARWKAGAVEYNLPTLGNTYTAEYDFWSSANVPADAAQIYFFAHCSVWPPKTPTTPGYNGYMFYADEGYTTMFTAYDGKWLFQNHTHVSTFDNSTWHKVKVVVLDQIVQTQIEMYYDNTVLLSYIDCTRDLSNTLSGFGAYKNSGAEIRIKNLKLYGPKPVTTYEIFIDGAHAGDAAGNLFTFTPSTPLAPGVHQWYIVAVENNVRLQSTNTFTFIVTGKAKLDIRSWDKFKTINDMASCNGLLGKDVDMDLAKAAGIKGVRGGFFWNQSEKTKGVLTCSGWEGIFTSCKSRDMRPLMILAYRNLLYVPANNSLPPFRTVEEQNAYANWAGAMAKQYAGNNTLWEIWNEPNLADFWNGWPYRPDSLYTYPANADDYCAMAKKAAVAIKAADTSGRVLGCACSGVPLAYLERCFYNGILDYVDAVSVHPYGSNTPEAFVDKYNAVRVLMRKYSPVADKIPILVSEWGWSTMSDTLPVDTERSEMVVRIWLVSSYLGCPVSSWYTARGWEYGLLAYQNQSRPAGTPTNAYYGAKTLLTTLNGYSFRARLDMANDSIWVLEFRNGSKQAFALWKMSGDPKSITVPLSGPNTGKLVKLWGDSSRITIPAAGGYTITISHAPRYLLLDNAVSISNAPRAPVIQQEIKLIRSGHRVLFAGFADYDKAGRIRIYDLKGHFVKELAINSPAVLWNGENQEGGAIAAGLYIAKIKTNKKMSVHKIIMP